MNLTWVDIDGMLMNNPELREVPPFMQATIRYLIEKREMGVLRDVRIWKHSHTHYSSSFCITAPERIVREVIVPGIDEFAVVGKLNRIETTGMRLPTDLPRSWWFNVGKKT